MKPGSGTNALASVLIIFVILFFGLLYYIKTESSRDEVPTDQPDTELSQSIDYVDKALSSIYFDVGITKYDIVSETESVKRTKDIQWRFKEIKIEFNTIIDSEEFTKSLSDRMRELVKIPYVLWNINDMENKTVLQVEILGLHTHNVTFILNPPLPKEILTDKTPDTIDGKDSESSTHKPSVDTPELLADLNRPRIVIIVDDLGGDKYSVDRLLEIEADLSFAVLPNLPFSKYAAEKAHESGRDVLLHLPMEPNGSSGYTGADAGDGVLLVDMSSDEVISELANNILSVPYIVGVNNHMGSKFTEDENQMDVVLKKLKKEGLFFIDSRTSSKTTGYAQARKLGLKSAERDIFLDKAALGQDYVRDQLMELVQVAKTRGTAIGICHPYPETVKVLAEVLPTFKGKVDIIPASKAVK